MAALNPASAAKNFAALAKPPEFSPVSYWYAAFAMSNSAASNSIQFSASGCCILWFFPIGLSNTILSPAYLTALDNAFLPIPRASAAIKILSGFKLSNKYLNPFPSSPTLSNSSTSRLSINIWGANQT